MKVIIYGATGKVGRHTVAAVLSAGHSVTAVGRNIDAITTRHKDLKIEAGDIRSTSDMNKLTPGHDVVITTFGAPLSKETILHRPDLCELGTQNIVASMKADKPARLICQTSLGAGDSRGHGRAVFAKIIEPLLLRRIMKDRDAQENIVRRSGLASWVIVRPAELTNSDASRNTRVISSIEAEPEPSTISRADVGAFLATLVDDQTFDHSAIVITN